MQQTTGKSVFPRKLKRFLPGAALTWAVGLGLLLWLMWAFLSRSIWLGLWGLTNDLDGISPFYDGALPLVTFLMFFHMITGALMILLACLQLAGPLRHRAPVLHRWMGRAMVGLGLITALGGLFYALFHGTTGGTYMDVSSTLYAVMVFVSAGQTLRTGMARRWAQHRRWGMRLAVLALASWLYRMHYVIWHALVGDLWVTPDMRGPFDVVQAWGFFLGYAAMLELYFLWESRRKQRPRKAAPPAAAVSTPAE